jgi:hypothetical protein
MGQNGLIDDAGDAPLMVGFDGAMGLAVDLHERVTSKKAARDG